MQCIQNIGLTISPIIAGYIVEKYGFFILQVYIIILTSC